jgi:RNA 2',3'-cyclic 3'-phosphodiesterase
VPADDEERWRVFLAIDVPDPVREALKEPLSALDPLRESLRLNDVERMHLTLHFLGHLPRTEVEKLPAALAPVTSRRRRFQLGAQGVGAFPGIGRPRVVWAGLAGADLPRLIELQSELGDGLRGAGVAVEDRFHAHLTLARARRPLKAPERTVLRDWSARWESASFGDVPVDQVRLMRSQLGGGPARYTTLATFDLQ